MGLREEAVAARKLPGPKSALNRLLDDLNGDERAEVVELVWESPDIGNRAIADVLTRHYGERVGLITEQQIRNHRDKPKP